MAEMRYRSVLESFEISVALILKIKVTLCEHCRRVLSRIAIRGIKIINSSSNMVT